MRIRHLAFVLALTTCAFAQVNKTDGAQFSWHSGTCPHPKRPDFMVHPSITEQADRLDIDDIHEILRTTSGLHDTYLDLQRPGFGNEATVPLLLERLRLDFGDSEPPALPRGVLQGFDCAQMHLIDALRKITNTDQGMYYPRWAKWWEANKTFTRERWIREGFVAGGQHFVEPVDERFGLELMDLLADGPHWQSGSARNLLESVPAETLAQWIKIAAISENHTRRMGALATLGSVQTTGHLDILRRFASDPHIEMRRRALDLLNERLRVSLNDETPVAAEQPYCSPDAGMPLVFVGDTLIVANAHGVAALDPSTRRTLWTQRRASGTGDLTLVTDTKLVFGSTDGTVVALSRGGRFLWRRESADKDDEKNRSIRLMQIGDEIVLVRYHSLERLNSETGETKSVIQSASDIIDASSESNSIYTLDNRGLHALTGEHLQDLSIEHPTGIAVSTGVIFLTSGEQEEARVTRVNATTLEREWERPVSGTGLWGSGYGAVLDGQTLFVPSDRELSAFDRSSGALLWTSSGGQEIFERIAPTKCGLMIESSHYNLELRDSATGEVRRIWPRITPNTHMAADDRFVAVTDNDGILWIVDLHGCEKIIN